MKHLTEYELSQIIGETALTHSVYPGTLWLHIKSGDEYWIDSLVFRESDMTVWVVYRKKNPAIRNPVKFARSVEEFTDRFRLVRI